MSYFGTDGIRGRFGEFPITPQFAQKLGFMAGRVLAEQNPRPKVVLGKDTRLSGYVLESALQSGLNSAGVDVYMLGVIPTPAIAHLTRAFHADAGIVISASHNPFFDNGIKFFSSEGKKLPDVLQQRIEQLLEDDMVIDADTVLGKSYRVDDAHGRYVEFCKSTFPYHLNLKGLTIVVDCAHGAGYVVAPMVLKELGATVIPVHVGPDGRNINDACGSTHPETLQQAVVQHQADLGLALDGDADRIIMVDHTGHIVDGDAILYILATQATSAVQGVVGTLMTNFGLERALKQRGIPLLRANVGDRYVMAALEEQGWILGGESSGHILCLDKSTTGDAIISGLQVLAAMVQQRASLQQLCTGYEPMPQCLINVKVAQKRDPYAIPELEAQIAQVVRTLADEGRVLIRASGTEPKIRVMVEAVNATTAQEYAVQLAKAIEQYMVV